MSLSLKDFEIMALWLIIINQGLRAISMIAVTVIYVALCA